MIVIVDENGTIVGHFTISPKSEEKKYAKTMQNAIMVDPSIFVENINLYQWDGNNFVLVDNWQEIKAQKEEQRKKEEFDQIKNLTLNVIYPKNYIEEFYPEIKQRSDVSDKENGESYLLTFGADIQAIRKKITELVLNDTDYTTALQDLLQTFPAPTNTNYWEHWLEQLLKIGYRNFFVFQVKMEYKQKLSQTETATTAEELQAIDTEYHTQFPKLG